MTRGPLAVVLSLLLSVMPIGSALADSSDPTGGDTCKLSTSAPEGSARLTWVAPDGEGVRGTWVSDPAMTRAAQRVYRCTTGWSTCEVKLAIEQGKHVRLSWKAWAIGIGGALVVGFVSGAAIAK